VDRERATKIDQLTQEASRLLDESVRQVSEGCSQRASGVYRSAVGRVMGWMATGLLSPIWREHGDLEPDEMRGPSDYNARDYEMPAAEAAAALAALSRARELMQAVASLVSELQDPAERAEYSNQLAAITDALADAASGVNKRRATR
jgi:hypothetical protein